MEDRREVEETNSEQSDSDNSKEGSLPRKRRSWVFIVVSVALCAVVSGVFWSELSSDEESLSETLRNLGAAYVTIAGITIAIYRSLLARDLAEAAQKQAEAARAEVRASEENTKHITERNIIAERRAEAAKEQITASREIATDQNVIAERRAQAVEDQIASARRIATEQNTIAKRRAQAAEEQITASRDIATDQNVIAERRAKAAEDQLAVSRETADKRVEAATAQAEAAKAQVEATKEQTRTALQYGEVAKESAQDARYRRGVEALGHDEMSIRLAGVYDLEALFHENYDRYGIRVVKLLCAFARNPPRLDTKMEICSPLREDVQTVISFIGGEAQKTFQAVDHDQKCEIDLRGAALPYADMREANMADVDFSEAILIRADFSSATLTGAEFRDANILGAVMTDATLENDQLEGAKHSKLVYGLEDSASSE